MVTVAVAGGTGGIGRTIVDELVQQGKHHVLILSRKAVTIPELSIPIIAANYEDQSDLRELLQKNNVDVVISTLSLFDEASATAQTNLIHAAIDSGTVTRFIPSEYGADYTTPGLAEAHPAAKWFNDAADLLRTSRLDFTRFIFGQLTDHYGFPKAPSHMKQFTYFLDFINKKAAIPGDGEAHATFLHSTDVAKYTAALLDEKKKWPEMSAFASDRMTWNALLRLAETITGVKWDVTHDSLDDLHKGKATYLSQPTGPRSYNLPPEAGQQMAAEFGILAAGGILGLPQHVLRNSEFPQIKPRTVEELITQAWGTEG